MPQKEEPANKQVGNEATPPNFARRAALAKIPWLGLSAFMLSLVIALINGYYALRGPEIVARPLKEVLVYRDGVGDNAVAVLTARVQLINTASSEYGDLLQDAQARIGSVPAWYPMQGEAEPVFTTQRPDCALGSRCHYLTNLVVIERGTDMVDVPGGTARSAYLTFALTPTMCSGSVADCAKLKNFPTAAQSLSEGTQVAIIRLNFNGDGVRELRCTLKPLDSKFLQKYGWQSSTCKESVAKGGEFWKF